MKCLIFLADGFEDCEALITVDMLRRAGIDIDTVTINETNEVTASHGVTMIADRTLKDTDPAAYDVLILPGGKRGTMNLEADERVKASIRKHVYEGKLMCAICAAPSMLLIARL